MHSIKLTNFTDLSLPQKELVLQWRNSEEVRKWMYSQDTISLKNHLHFIDSLKIKEDKVYFLVQKESDFVGVIDFTSIDRTNNWAEIGLYTNPTLKAKGEILMNCIFDYGFEKLRLGTLFANVLKTNLKAIKLYKKYNFIVYKEDRDLLYMELKNENR